jgi:hypothetical protein
LSISGDVFESSMLLTGIFFMQFVPTTFFSILPRDNVGANGFYSLDLFRSRIFWFVWYHSFGFIHERNLAGLKHWIRDDLVPISYSSCFIYTVSRISIIMNWLITDSVDHSLRPAWFHIWTQLPQLGPIFPIVYEFVKI